MRPYCYILILSILFAGCQNNHDTVSPLFKWRSISPVADSAVVALEREFIHVAPADTLLKYVDVIEKEGAQSSHRRQLMSRVYYWKARIANRENLVYEEWLKIAGTLCDSARYPYDMFRINYLSSVLAGKDNVPCYYSSLKDYEEYTIATGDDFMRASLLTDMGHLLTATGLTDKALKNYFEANSIYKRLGIVEYHLKTSLNNATILKESGRKDESREICRALLASKEARRDTNFYNELRLTAFGVFGNPAYLTDGYAEIMNDHKLERLRMRYEISLGYMYLDSDRVDQAVPYMENLLASLPDVKQSRMREYIYRMAYIVYNRKGVADSVRKYLELTAEERGAMLEEGADAKITAIENQAEIARVEQDALQKQHHDRMLVSMIVFALISSALVVVILLMRKAHRHKCQLMETRLSLEANQRKAVSTSLVMTEKDNMLESILEQINVMDADEKTRETQLRHLQQDIRLHLSGRQEWNDFQHIFEEVHPSFAATLKSRWPELSEGDIRLATYIKIGLTTKQIARMLLLQPDSVKKNRQRLRRRMGLSPEIVLEDLIREV